MNATIPELRSFERRLLAVESLPWFALYRIAIGGLVLPAWRWLGGGETRAWTLVAWLLAFLFALRLFPALLRKMLPVSRALSEAWAARRRLAKRFDSYQWRKLFWLGCGMALSATVTPAGLPIEIATIGFCLVSGAVGSLVWRKQRGKM